MPQVCKVCKHPQRAEIDRSLVERTESLRDIARRNQIATASLHRHKAHLPVELTKAKNARKVADSGALLVRVESVISRLERIATKAEDSKQWLAASGALREVRGCLQLLGQLSGELGSGTTINVSVHLQRSLAVVLGLGPEEFTRFFGAIFKQASEAQLHSLLSSQETQDALCVSPLFDSRFNDDAVDRAGRESLSAEERDALDRINAKLKGFRDERQSVKCGTSRIVVSRVEMAL